MKDEFRPRADVSVPLDVTDHNWRFPRSLLQRTRVGVIAPVPSQLNPYVSLMRKSVEEMGEVEYRLNDIFSTKWFLENWQELDVLHLHWLEYVCAARSRWGTWRKLTLFVAALAWCRAKGIKVVYTVHNVEPHGAQRRAAFWLASKVVYTWADALHVHEECTREEVVKKCGRPRVIQVIPHGNYIGAYPNESSSSEARRALGLDENAFVYLFLGQIRPNKGVEDLIYAFSRLEDPSARLVIAGWAPDDRQRRLVAGLASADERISLHLAFVPDAELQYFFNASDICVLPYRRFTTSGAILLALSFGRPVIGPRTGSFVEVVTDGSGTLYDAEDPAALYWALATARETTGLDSKRMAFDRALSYDWVSIGTQHVALYRELCGRT